MVGRPPASIPPLRNKVKEDGYEFAILKFGNIYDYDDNYKDYFVKLLSKEVKFKDQTQYLDNAIHSYVKNLLMNLKRLR